MSTKTKSKSKRKASAKGEAAVAKEEKVEAPAKATKKAKPKKAGGQQELKRISVVDAVAQDLAKADKPMRAQDLIAAMVEQGLWKSPAGATPHATLYAAMMREERDQGSASRFRKVDRGMFAFHAAKDH